MRPTFILSLILSILLSACGQIKIIQKPIIFDKQRAELSLAYLKDRYGLEQESPNIVPKMVVVHYTVIPTWEKTFDAFNPVELPGSRVGIKSAGNLNVSSHFVVDRDGTIYRLLPDTVFARHVIGLNHCAIGIENVADGNELPLTKAQLKANKQIVKYLSQHHEIEYLIGHHEYKSFEGHELWLEKDEGYRTEKTDPGDEFMRKLRTSLKKLKLKGVPGE